MTSTLSGAILLAVAMSSARADAQNHDDVGPRERTTDSAAELAQGGAFLPDTSPAKVGRGRGVASAIGGYDRAQSSAVFTAAAEVFVLSHLALRIGGAYVPSDPGAPMQPQFGLRWQLASQQAGHGIDASLGLLYRRDRVTEDSGVVQAVASVGRTFGRLGTIANLAYGQDAEGDDRLTELRLSGLYLMERSTLIGATASAESAWGSTDSRRTARGEATYQARVGPMGEYVIGSWAVLLQTGADVIKTTTTRGGVFVLGGFGTTL